MKHEQKCPFCDVAFVIEFEDVDDELLFCPSCGEEFPEEVDLSSDTFYGADDWEDED